MKMLTYGANTMREIDEFVSANGISKEMIVNIMQTNDGTFMISYFSKD